MAKNIVDIPAEDLTRNGWSLKMEDDKVKALYESKLRQLKAKERLQQLFTYERLYGDGFVSIGTIEKREYSLSEPLDFENIKSVPYINAFSGKRLVIELLMKMFLVQTMDRLNLLKSIIDQTTVAYTF